MEDILVELESKISNIGADDLFKKKIGNFEIWFCPLTWVDQGFVQNALEEGTKSTDTINALQEAKLKTLARSIVGIDDIDLRQYRNGAKVFKIKGRDKKDVNVDLAHYMEQKIKSWGQTFIDLAFDVYADINETSRKKFSDNVVFDNAKDPRVELAELEAKVHELRARLGLPVLAEKPGTSYENNQGELEEVAAPEGPEDTPSDETISSKDFVADENSEPESESTPPEASSPQDILESVEVPEPGPTAPEPTRTIPVSEPNFDELSPIQRAQLARKNMARPVRQVPNTARSTPDAPIEPFAGTRDEVIEERAVRPTGKPRIDPPIRTQSVNPRYKAHS